MPMNMPQGLTPASASMAIPTAHSSRPTLGFPLGTALLLLVIFSLSGIFSCCYHWDRLRSLLWSRHPGMLQEGPHTIISIGSAPSKAASEHKSKKAGKECGLPVIMPGDDIPKFYARPCPHEACLPAAGQQQQQRRAMSRCKSDVQFRDTVSICIRNRS
ncbi:unnamed protein product [Triticum turgidum subsp. durum]|uniref:Uncharacterized protein n=1 Tax=Triticum turgidum subsp. durum TaxID=4567 RepID=A0A9R0XPY7_TRITD|nr:unnamed protein product [Triticum turgidum subsp. durum]